MNWRAKHQNKQRKYLVLSHYSPGGVPHCACCGERHIEFLAINHINHNGNEHRKQLEKQHIALYTWLIRNHFPEGFNVLCFNCNFADGHFEGGCPHKKDQADRKVQMAKLLVQAEIELKKMEETSTKTQELIESLKARVSLG